MRRSRLVLTVGLLAGALALTACSSGTSTADRSDKPAADRIAVPAPDAGVAAILPKGPHTFTASFELNKLSASLSGYVDFDDCTTDATASYIDGGGEKHTVAYRNSGDGEAFSADGGAWTSTDDPFFDMAITSLFSPILISSFSVPAANSIVCSLNLLAQYASLPDTGAVTDTGVELVWDHARIQAYNDQARRAFGEAFYRAAGATDSDIAALRASGEFDETFIFDVPSTDFLGRITPRVTRSGESTIIELIATTESGKKVPLTYTFIPTAKRVVEPVEFTKYLDSIRAEAKASGKSFDEILNGSVGQ
jgi:hypothetical protein